MTENKEKNYMITQDGCGACEAAKKMLKDRFKNGKLIDTPVDSELGKKFAKEHNIKAVPTIINENDGNFQKCLLSKDGQKIFCEDGSEKPL
jgi:glutaredoxin